MKKKLFVGLGLSLAVTGTVAALIIQINKPTGPSVRESTTLMKQNLENTVSVTGNVESVSAINVYSNLGYPIQNLEVEVGDVVKEGDLLCQLDTSNLLLQIAETQATINASAASTSFTLNSTLNQYDTSKAAKEVEWDTRLAKAEQSLATAELDVRTSRHNYRNARDNGADESEKDSLSAIAEMKYVAYEAAQDNLKSTKAEIELERKMWEENYANDIKKAELGTNLQAAYIGLQQLNKNLSDATIVAPISGTVTAVYAKEGAVGSGLLFVIEDTESLKVTTEIKEYDVTSLKPGNRVVIKSDATGDEEYEGMVSTIAPTSVKDASGNTVDTTDVKFLTDILVLTAGTPLRIGMNSRVNIVVDEKSGAFAIPYEMLVEEPDGGCYVYIAVPAEEGNRIARKVPVTLGLETDFLVEIISPELKEGDEILSDISGLADGDPVRISKDDEATASDAASGAA